MLAVTVDHQVVGHSVRVAVAHELHGLEGAVAPELSGHHRLVPIEAREARVRLHASDEVRRRPVERRHERVDVLGEPPAHRGERGPTAGARVLPRGALGGALVARGGHRRHLATHPAHALPELLREELVERVVVLLEEAVGRIRHGARKVLDGEGGGVGGFGGGGLLDDKALVPRVLLRDRRAIRGVARLRRPALRIEDPEQSDGRLLDQPDARLVVGVGDLDAADALVRVRRLLHLEDELQEELVQLLVREVDAELLERVGLERFEAEDVEQTDEAHGGGGTAKDRAVDSRDDPIEQQRVQRLAERRARRRRLRDGQLDVVEHPRNLHRAFEHEPADALDAEEGGAELEELRVSHLSVLTSSIYPPHRLGRE